MSKYFYWDPDPCAFKIPIIDHPIAWYGILFSIGFLVGTQIIAWLFNRLSADNGIVHVSKHLFGGKQFSEKLLIYVGIATIAGSRIGHLLFYEDLLVYLKAPYKIFMLWEGGLASHGAVTAIFVALFFFWRRYYTQIGKLSFKTLLDLLILPALIIGAFVRIGNFLNQEILGKPTNIFCGVIFGSPIDGSAPVPRHPAQLYEAFFYLLLFIIMSSFWKKLINFKGLLAGLFFSSAFLFRFFIEFVKEEQSLITANSILNMGQWLSIPFIVLGFALTYQSLVVREELKKKPV